MSWQKELENGVRSMEQLAPKLGLSPEEAQRREIDNEYPKAWKNAMVMLHMYIKTGKSNFGKQK